MEKHLSSGSVPSPAASVTEPAALFPRPLRSLHCDSSAGTSCLCSAPHRVTHRHFLMDPETSTAVTPARVWRGHLGPLAHGKFWLVLVYRRETEEMVSFCTQESVFSVSV